MNSEIADLTHLRRGSLNLAGGMSVCTYLFPNLLRKFRSLYPDIELKISTGITEEILRMLRSNEVDLALLSLPFTESDLAVIPALREELVLVMEENHPLAMKEHLSFSDLEPFTFIHFERGSNTRKLLDRVFHEERVQFRTTMELQNVEITKPLVEQGLGISFIPYQAWEATQSSRKLNYRRIGGKRIFRELGWVYLKSDYMSRTMRRLLDLFNEMTPSSINVDEASGYKG
jgi:DNA-binding transcriptional LysR family regulator